MLTRVFLIALALTLTLSISEASVSREQFHKSAAHPGKCFIDGHVLKVGQTIKHPLVKCAEITCVNSIGLTTIESCDPISALPPPATLLKNYDPKDAANCQWEEELYDTSAPYPKCCRRYFRCLA